jgi:hypothetical protein
MSKQKDSGLILFQVTEKNLSKVMREKFVDDEDFNGNNGEEYISDKAKRKGFESNKDFAYDKAEKKTAKMTGLKKVKTFINVIVNELKNDGGDYYSNIECEIEQVGKIYVVATMSETSW